ncbi:MAG: lysoplasmalogenase [Gemmatimonadetes bacterium]|nr:lysoplasmalogenase [Gemmatimonadota bacterium]
MFHLAALLLAAVAFLLRAASLGDQVQVWVFKPLATLLVIALALSDTRRAAGPYRTWVAWGLVASLVGDVLLMLPQDLFLPGLLAFLVAHLCYLRAFTSDARFTAVLATGVPLIVVAVFVVRAMWPGLGPLRVPVIAYVSVIVAMAWQALERWRQGSHPGAQLAGIGALLFMASDAALGVNRFRGPFPGSAVLVLGTYYAAQFLIAASVRKRAAVPLG